MSFIKCSKLYYMSYASTCQRDNVICNVKNARVMMMTDKDGDNDRLSLLLSTTTQQLSGRYSLHHLYMFCFLSAEREREREMEQKRNDPMQVASLPLSQLLNCKQDNRRLTVLGILRSPAN